MLLKLEKCMPISHVTLETVPKYTNIERPTSSQLYASLKPCVFCILIFVVFFFWCIVLSVGYLHRGARQPPPCTPWLSCRFTKPRRSNRCTRVVGERRPPRPSQAPSRPGSRRSGPDAGNPEILEFALSQETARTAPLLPPVEGREENLLFRFVSVPPLVQGPPSQRKSNFLFLRVLRSMGRQCATALPPHSRPRPILPVAKRVRFGDDIPPHAPLASPVRDPGSSVRMPQNAPPSVPSTPTPFRCTTTGTSIVPLEPLAQRLEAWLTLPSLSRWLTRTIRLGYAIQFARRPPKFNGVLETVRWQSETPLYYARRLLSSWQRMQSSRSLQPR